MDSVELTYLRGGVTELEPPRELGRLVSPSPELCSSSVRFKDVTNSSSKSEPSKHDGQHRSTYQGEDLSRHLHTGSRNGFLLNNGIESAQLYRKSVKVSKTGSLPPKRPRLTELEGSDCLVGVDGIRDMPDKLGSYLSKCNSADKTRLAKQKTKFSSKRGDKRIHKTKNDSFSVKAGLASFTSAAGGNNFFGVHGLKSDNHDVTKHVDDLPLNELLDGTHKHLSLGKDRGKKPANVNDSLVHSVRKACSILQLPRSVQPQHNAEVDSHSEMKMSTLPLSRTSAVPNGVNGDKGESSVTDLSSSNKVHDSCTRLDSLVNPLDMPLSRPDYILEHLDLPSHKDLESLLLDATKPGLFSKSAPDPYSGKHSSQRASLPPFPWSNISSWHCRSSSDAAKLSTSRGTCQGRWLRIERNTLTSLGIASGDYTDLEAMTYDQTLVPCARLKKDSLPDKISPTISVLPQSELDSSAPATCLKESYAMLDSEAKVNHSGNSNDDRCSNILAAAQTLCGMGTNPFIRNLDGILSWQKKPLQKAMKACKLNSHEKPDDVFGSSIAASGSDNLPRRSIDRMLMLPPKKPKLSLCDDRKDYNNFSSVRKESIRWSTPRSSRSLPSKSGKESIGSIRHSTSDVAKHSYMMPPPSRVPEKSSHKRDKLRNLLTMEWNRGRDRLD